MGRPKLLGKTVIGLDESNNGFQEKGLPLIIAAHVIKDYSRAIPNNEAYERKILAYAPKERERFVGRAREFLRRNSSFCYSTISKVQLDQFGLIGRARAMASLVARAIEMYNLKGDLAIVAHRLDNSSRTKFVAEHFRNYLKEAEIQATMEFRADEQRNRAIRKADRVAYYIGGLKFTFPSKHWPYRSKKTPIDYHGEFISRYVVGEDDFPNF